jgi:hypothetical protein
VAATEHKIPAAMAPPLEFRIGPPWHRNLWRVRGMRKKSRRFVRGSARLIDPGVDQPIRAPSAWR